MVFVLGADDGTSPNTTCETTVRGLSALRTFAAAGAALIGAGVIVVTPVTAPPPDVHVPDIQLTSDEQDIVIDFVRHAQTNPPGDVVAVASNGVPGFALSDLGEQQSVAVANKLFEELGGPNGVTGIFGGQEQRMIETAAPFDTLEHMVMQPIAGSNDYNGNQFDEVVGNAINTIYHDAPAAG